MHPYLNQMCQNAKNMYNAVNFYIRQVFTGLKGENTLHPLQQEVLETIRQNLEPMNEKQQQAYQRRLEKESKKPVEKQKEVTCNLFEAPTKEKPYLHYNFLNSLFHVIKQPDYLSLPIQSSQWVMKAVFQNWKSFYASLRDYKDHPVKYNARPRIPGYSRTSAKDIIFTNQDCCIKEQKYLKFPKTKLKLNIGKLGMAEGKLMQVRIIPKYGHYVVELVRKVEYDAIKPTDSNRCMALDLGINNLVSGVTNTGTSPFIIKGGNVKSINQYYNKQKAHLLGVLRHGKTSNEGPFTSKRLERLHQVRHRKLKDIFHKASHKIVNLALEEKVDTIIIGKNEGWKQKINIGKTSNQSFVSIPHAMLINMITYKAEKGGIRVITIEESYTSKASYIDGDDIPVYNDTKGTPVFTGKRVKRGLYRTCKGSLLNADINGAANIFRKFVGKSPKKQVLTADSVNVWQPRII
ncbi:RNA-guided endonuclease InsQ/TnpB family protein [Virgibacillus oceani]